MLDRFVNTVLSTIGKYIYMRNLVFILGLLLAISGCTSSEVYENVIFSGTYTRYQHNSNSEQIDTFSIPIRLKLNRGNFAILDEVGTEGCIGEYTRSNRNIEFESGDCACWCACDPRIDCAGHPILGNFQISYETNDELRFQARHSYETTSNYEITTDYFYDLKAE